LARARAFQARGRGFESRFPLHAPLAAKAESRAHVAQVVEHVLGKDEVSGSSPLVGSTVAKPELGTRGEAMPSEVEF
jgi:hypothetical protein